MALRDFRQPPPYSTPPYNPNGTAPGVPEIAQAYQNDPRTKIALSLMDTSTAPVAGGGWGVADGIARALSGIAGGFIDKAQRRKYDRDEAGLLEARKADVPQDVAQRIAGALSGGGDGGDIQVNSAALRPAPMGSAAPPLPGISPQQPPAAPVAPPTAFQPTVAPSMVAPSPVARSMAAPRPQGVAPFTDPLSGRGHVTSKYGPRTAPIAGASTFHNGVDMAAPLGTPVQAAGNGVVVQAWFDKAHGGGNSIIVRHEDGTKTGYAHLSEIGVKQGDPVQAGQVIGAVGQTGRATGPHLHFTVRDASGKRIDPTSLKMNRAEPGQPQDQAAQEAPANSASDIYGGQPPVLPEVPAPLEKPTLPTAEAATQSERLQQAYRMLLRGNKYEAAAAQTMLDKGLGQQDQFNESATERKQRLAEKGYDAEMGMFAADRSARTESALNARNTYNSNQQQYQQSRSLNEQNFGYDMRKEDKRFLHEMKRAGFDRETSYGLANLNNSAELKRAQMQIDANAATKEEAALHKRDLILQTPFGRGVSAKIEQNSEVEQLLDNFEGLNHKYGTGGFLNNYAPGVITPNNSTMQELEVISNKLTASGASLLKGSTSDKDVQFLLGSVPSKNRLGPANTNIVRNWREGIRRSNEYHEELLAVAASGSPAEQAQFIRDWNRFKNEVSIRTGGTFADWKAQRASSGAPVGVIRVDAQGRVIK